MGATSRRFAAGVCAVLAVACGLTAASASASTQYFVTVSNLEGQFDRAPENVELRVSPALPEGASLTGRASCEEVYKPGTNQTESVNSFPAPGSYQFVTDSCKSDESDPLTLHGVSGSLQILGGVYNIAPNPTRLAGIAVEGESASHEPTVAFAASVINETLDDSPIPEQGVLFTYQHSGGLPFLACQATSTGLEQLQETGQSIASCVVEGQPAKEIEEGDGVWTASYSGTSEYSRSTTNGQVPGKETLAQGTQELQESVTKNGITIEEKEVPPNCERHTESIGLINISLGELNCTELKILQYTTQACLLVTAVVGGETAITGVTAELIKRLAATAVELAVPPEGAGGVKATLEAIEDFDDIDEVV